MLREWLEPLHWKQHVSWQKIFGNAHEKQCPQAFRRTLAEAPTFRTRDLFGSGYAGLGVSYEGGKTSGFSRLSLYLTADRSPSGHLLRPCRDGCAGRKPGGRVETL